MNHFFNHADNVVDEVLQGLGWLQDVHISQPDSGMRLVVAADHDPNQVAVISGGGAGHEPAHAGFVGSGMLTVAVVGDLFTSPSVEAVLAAIRQVTGPAGCLLIIKNYTGDRLNFGLAAERATREGYNVRTVIVADDISLPESISPRGLAGTVLVHKVAGYHAAYDADLDTVTRMAEQTSQNLLSIGLAIAPAALPDQARRKRAPELGLGIHNEAGVREIEPGNAAQAVQMALDPLLARMDDEYDRDTHWLVMLNNLGGCSSQEMAVLTHELCRQLADRQIAGAVNSAKLMTSMDMHGFSVTLLAVDDNLYTALASNVTPASWPGLTQVTSAPTFQPIISQQQPTPTGHRDEQVDTRLEALCQQVISARQQLDELDAQTGDGDAGTAFARGARVIQDALQAQRLSTGEPGRLAGEIGDLLAHAMGGSSGVLLSILLTATGSALQNRQTIGNALLAGMNKMQTHGGARPGDRTLLDALLPAAQALTRQTDWQAAAAAARQGANQTATMTRAGAGRSAYIPAESLRGVTDPGAEAVALVFEALAKD